jgi:hypothetical protein
LPFSFPIVPAGQTHPRLCLSSLCLTWTAECCWEKKGKKSHNHIDRSKFKFMDINLVLVLSSVQSSCHISLVCSLPHCPKWPFLFGSLLSSPSYLISSLACEGINWAGHSSKDI